MLASNSYPRDYVEACRRKIQAQAEAYDRLVAAAGKAGSPVVDEALDLLESAFFNNMVVVLDSFFVHRTRGLEGKDGNPLNEVRMLVASMLSNDGVMMADKQIKMNPATSVLGHSVGDDISLTAEDFRRLADAFLAAIAARYP